MSTTDLVAYAARLDKLLGNGTATFDKSKWHTNNVIGALNRKQFSGFTSNFDERVRRLKNWFQGNIKAEQFVIRALNELSSDKNWDGAYAEIAAVDYFATVCKITAKHMDFDVVQPANRTLASEMGMKNIDYDFALCQRFCLIDVKTLSNKSKQIIDSVIHDAKTELGLSNLRVVSFFNADTDYNHLRDNRKLLVHELSRAIVDPKKPTEIRSRVITGLKYQLVWSNGIYSSVSTYSPEQHATKHHTLLFQHAKKFHRRKSDVHCVCTFSLVW